MFITRFLLYRSAFGVFLKLVIIPIVAIIAKKIKFIGHYIYIILTSYTNA